MAHFGTTQGGDPVEKITLRAGSLQVSILTLGAIIQDVRLDGVEHGLTLGSDDLSDYETGMGFHGAIVGPIANRISNARVRLDGMMYELERNDGAGHLHSGSDGTHRQIWTIAQQSKDSVTLTLDLADGVNGLPGRRQITATFSVTPAASLTLDITGTTDIKTLMNFANHSYWNLDGSDSWEGHKLQVAADHYLPTNDASVPTGDILDVDGTDMDFRTARAFEKNLPALDHNFCLPETAGDILTLTGTSGASMTVATTLPGIQVYDGRGAQRPGKATYEGLAIEPQHWPDAPNHRGFPSITVAPDTPYRQTSRWTFTA